MGYCTTMHAELRTLLFFVDGLGLGEPDPERNPLYSGACPTLQRLLDNEATGIDAGLGVDGPPQSATGQATLLTGQNAAALMGRHMEGLPGPRLKEFVREHNLFSELAARGYASTFANAYFTDDVEEVKTRRRQSVTTVSALEAFGGVRHKPHLMRNEAVYQDLTREYLREHGYDGPLVSPAESARHLLSIAEQHSFTLFEYFQTDLAAHRGSDETVRHVLARLDEFLGRVLDFARVPSHLFVLTSDHGNIEDSGTRTHTVNPVPLVVLGQHAERLQRRVRSLVDFVPALLELYPPRQA